MNCNLSLFEKTLRTHICLSVAFIFASLLHVSGSFAQEIKWYPDLNSATQAAAAQNKLVLVHFTADWCRPCKTLESFVFTNPSVQRSFDSNVIAVKLDVEEHRDLVQEYAVSTVPYDVALTATGRVVSKRKSPMDASTYNKMISDYGVIINSLDSDKNPGLAQNLDELKDLMRNENPNFDGQTTSFTPDAPTHQGPRPSHESAELNRKSQFISNPYLHKPQTAPPASPQRVANVFVETQNSSPDSKTNNFSVVPNFVPNPIPAIDNNQFVPAGAGELVPVNPMPSNREVVQTPLFQGPATSTAPTHSDTSLSQGTDNFAPNMVQGELIVARDLSAPSISNQSAPELTRTESFPSSAPARLEPAEVTGILVGEKEHQPNDTMKPEPKTVLDDQFYGKPSPKSGDVETIPGNYQAKIRVPESQDFVTVQPSNKESLSRSEKPAKPSFALHGKCPVALLTESKWVNGDKQWGCVHRNRVYIFANEANLKRFQSDPDGFSPVLAGFDPVIFHETGKLIDGLEEHGVFMGKTNLQRVVLFSSPETRAKFQSEPRKYLDTVQQAMQSSPNDSSALRR